MAVAVALIATQHALGKPLFNPFLKIKKYNQLFYMFVFFLQVRVLPRKAIS
jgi:hypothetical protein